MIELYHYGTPRHSGRYPYGSGERPFQGEDRSKIQKGISEKKRLAKEITGKDISTRDARVANRTLSDNPIKIKRGNTVQHITGVQFDRIRKGQLYVTATELDNKLYEAFLGMRLKSKGWNPQKVKLTLKEDLKAPSEKTQMNIFSDMIKDNKDEVIKDISSWLLHKGKISSIDDGVDKYQKMPLRDLYMDFNNSLEFVTNLQKKFYDILKRNGYNAVIDEHDKYGSWMQGEKPIIIMDALATVGEFTLEDINSSNKLLSALDDYMMLNRKKGG